MFRSGRIEGAEAARVVENGGVWGRNGGESVGGLSKEMLVCRSDENVIKKGCTVVQMKSVDCWVGAVVCCDRDQ